MHDGRPTQRPASWWAAAWAKTELLGQIHPALKDDPTYEVLGVGPLLVTGTATAVEPHLLVVPPAGVDWNDVVEVEESDGGGRWLRLIPSAPATGRPARRGDLYAAVSDVEGEPGLARPHVFVASRLFVTTLDGTVSGGKGGAAPPVLGRLTGRARARLEALRRRSARKAVASA